MNCKAYMLMTLLPLAVLPGCDLGNGPEHDPQMVRIQLDYHFRNAVNTFDGTLTKDLIMDGSVTVPFWFTTEEQRQIAARLEQADFYALPDTIRQIPGVFVSPDPGSLILRVRNDRGEKVVVMHYPPDQTNDYWKTVEELGFAIWTIVEATPAYQQLPPARGAYL